MSRFLTFLTVCVVLAIVQAALTALLVALAILLLYAFVTRPRETLVFVGTLLLFGLANAQPVAFIIAVAIVALAVVVAGGWPRSRRKLLLTDGRQHRPPEPGRQAQDLLG